jgi:hypothetical protein
MIRRLGFRHFRHDLQGEFHGSCEEAKKERRNKAKKQRMMRFAVQGNGLGAVLAGRDSHGRFEYDSVELARTLIPFLEHSRIAELTRFGWLPSLDQRVVHRQHPDVCFFQRVASRDAVVKEPVLYPVLGADRRASSCDPHPGGC